MAKVIVTPQEFHLVRFEADQIERVISSVADRVGIDADAEIRVEVDESTPLGRARVASVDPITLTFEGGAFEDPKRPRHLSERGTAEVVARLLFRVRDRLDPGFGEVPADDDLDLQHTTAWDTYAVGRAGRAGIQVSKPRRLYHFRNRHGFTDVADECFQRLWDGDGLTWADIDAMCERTAAERGATS